MAVALQPHVAPRLKPGDRVRIDTRPAQGHCRTPFYLRGKEGEVVEVLGCYRDPERMAYHRAGYPGLHLYKVRFLQTHVWPAYTGPATDHLEADIFENWLEPA
jgi:nitrile hydratase